MLQAIERPTARRLAALAVAAALAGCNPIAAIRGDGTGPRPVSGPASEAAPGPIRLDSDVEAPEVFAVEGQALWDGRPSLGGTWVAAPDVREPERVLMRNLATGQSVVGALFRRERISPGPSLQLSSEAAIALGILAGAPTPLSVVALRPRPDAGPAAEPVAAPSPEVAVAGTAVETALP